jgi:hypothetical protein
MFKSIKLINAGFLLGLAFSMWLFGDAIERDAKNREESKWAGDNPDAMEAMYQKYKTNA